MLHSIYSAGNMRRLSISCAIMIAMLTIWIQPCVSYAYSADELRKADEERIRAIDQSAESMYQHASRGDVQKARLELARLERLVTQTRFDGVVKLEGLEAFAAAIVTAKRSFQAVKPMVHDHAAAVSVRLAADALSHRNNPLWYRYKQVLQEDIAHIRNTYQARDAAKFNEALTRLENHYELIRPAVLITREPYVAERIESLFTFIRNRINAGGIRDKALLGGLARLKEVTDGLFEERDHPTMLPILPVHNPWYWSMLISLIIVAVLSYSGWLRYRAERDYRLVKRTGGGPS